MHEQTSDSQIRLELDMAERSAVAASATSRCDAARAKADPGRRSSASAIGVLLGCVVVAAYTGIRMPSLWTATLQCVSLQEGFHRRFLVGSLLRPIAEPAGYAYGLFAAVSFVVLAALVAVLVRVAVITRNPAQRLLIVAFLLLPTGGYLFHEVGYFDQLLYLMLFGALWLLGRGRWIAASSTVALAVTVHEITVLTVLPLFFLAAVRLLPLRRALLAVTPATLVGGVILLSSAAADGAGDRLGNRLTNMGFPVRPDALELFSRTQADSWQMYSPLDVLLFLLPLLVIVVGALLAFTWTNERLTRRSACLLVLSMAAAAAPTVLAAAGWDMERWAFLLIANLCIVLWLLLEEHTTEVSHASYTVLVVTLLLTAHVPLTYFDGYAPRALTVGAISEFAELTGSGHFTDAPAQ